MNHAGNYDQIHASFDAIHDAESAVDQCRVCGGNGRIREMHSDDLSACSRVQIAYSLAGDEYRCGCAGPRCDACGGESTRGLRFALLYWRERARAAENGHKED